MDSEKLLDFFAEAGQLKRVRRSGWWLAGIPHPESVAEHVYRTALIGHVLARMEGVDPKEVLVMILYHDLAEARLNDMHKIGRYYVDLDGPEERVRADQLPDDEGLRSEITSALNAFESGSSPEAVVAKDADILECVVQGKEYLDAGFRQAEEWCAGKRDLLRTKSARALYDRIKAWDSAAWHKNARGRET